MEGVRLNGRGFNTPPALTWDDLTQSVTVFSAIQLAGLSDVFDTFMCMTVRSMIISNFFIRPCIHASML